MYTRIKDEYYEIIKLVNIMRLKKLYIFIFLIITIFALSGCKNSETKDLNSKVNEEINYMSVSLISILNKLNNISFENYYVTTE